LIRVLLVGSVEERARLRTRLTDLVAIVGEFPTLAAARASGIDGDAVISATRAGDGDEIYGPLTPREIEVLELLSEGLSNKAIAGRLGISDQTVKFHVASICGKLGAANRTDAVRRAIRRGLISV